MELLPGQIESRVAAVHRTPEYQGFTGWSFLPGLIESRVAADHRTLTYQGFTG